MRSILLMCLFAAAAAAQMPKIEPGVSEELAKWRAVQYSNISYKLNLTLEKMSPVLKGSIEIHVTQAAYACSDANCPKVAIVLDWRKIPGHEDASTVTNVSLNGAALSVTPLLTRGLLQAGAQVGSEAGPSTEVSDEVAEARASARALPGPQYEERDDHLIFHDGVRMGENVIKLDFTSPILTSGSAITRYIDKEDGSEYIYSLFVPSDASTAFPCFDQPDLKARFRLTMQVPKELDGKNPWTVITNAALREASGGITEDFDPVKGPINVKYESGFAFNETQPISTYVFAFAAGPWAKAEPPALAGGTNAAAKPTSGQLAQRDTQTEAMPPAHAGGSAIYVRRSQLAKFQPHAAEVARLRDEGIKYLESYFDYKFPFPKLDLVLIPEFPFGGMEHAGAIFLREDRVIFPAEPTKGDYLTRANLIFHETAHQWFGDTVTMKWFDDLWLKEGFAEFMAYKTLEKVMPDANAWKVFYERNKQAAYATDSTRGTTPIYQPISNLSAAKSAYGNIVYRKAPSFLRQAEFYLGEDKFQTAVRAFLQKHEFGNATWEDLVKEFEAASGQDLKEWASSWVKTPGVAIAAVFMPHELCWMQEPKRNNGKVWDIKVQALLRLEDGSQKVETELRRPVNRVGFECTPVRNRPDKSIIFGFPNYQDYGYGIFLLDDKSRDYVLKYIGEEKDPFLRSMMWGALWDSVREAELDPREYVELAIKNLGGGDAQARTSVRALAKGGTTETDETIIQSLVGRVSTALNYYIPALDHALANARASATSDLRSRFEDVLLDRLQHAPTAGQRITFYRAYVANASSDKARGVLKQMLRQGKAEPPASAGGTNAAARSTSGKPEKRDTQTSAKPPANAGGSALRTKDKFDIVTRLIILGDPEAPKLLADLEKKETSDDAKRYAYAARAAFGTADNKAKFFNDLISNKDISESWIESAAVPFNSITQAELTQPYLARALAELPNLKRTRKIFFVNNWLAAFIAGQRDQKALDIINKFLADNPDLDDDLKLKVLENMDLIERAVKIRSRQ